MKENGPGSHDFVSEANSLETILDKGPNARKIPESTRPGRVKSTPKKSNKHTEIHKNVEPKNSHGEVRPTGNSAPTNRSNHGGPSGSGCLESRKVPHEEETGSHDKPSTTSPTSVLIGIF